MGTVEERWGSYDTIATALDTGLNSLGNGNTALSAAVDFAATGVDKKKFMDVELSLATIDTSSQTNPAVYLWVLARTDGTNFEDGSAGTPGTIPARQPDAIIPLRKVSGAQRLSARLLFTTPDQGKLLLQNNAGVAFNASGNTLKYYTYGNETVS